MLNPSNVLVPRPISSKINRLLLVAFRRIFATSVISTIKVLCPDARSSDAPTLVKIRSQIPILALSAGTNDPICAIKTISADWRIYVDFPAIFGPVMMETRFFLSSSSVSFAINILSGVIFSTTGCLPPLMSISPFSLIFGRT